MNISRKSVGWVYRRFRRLPCCPLTIARETPLRAELKGQVPDFANEDEGWRHCKEDDSCGIDPHCANHRCVDPHSASGCSPMWIYPTLPCPTSR